MKMEEIKVIDISYAQPKVDFAKVREDGVKAVIIRTGYLGKTDTMFDSHMKGAIEAGLDIGVYTYIMSENAAQAITEAKETVKRLEKYKGFVNYPVYCDMEAEKFYSDKFSKASRTGIIRTFCSEIQKAGYYAAIYTNPSWLEEWTDKTKLLPEYDLWLAAWTNSPAKPTKYSYGQKMWQWGTGRVNGINGAVDGDLCYVDYPSEIRKAGLNFLPAEEKKYILTAVKTVPESMLSEEIKTLEKNGFSVSVKSEK